jgi:phospholipid transport system substrate-binding protein
MRRRGTISSLFLVALVLSARASVGGAATPSDELRTQVARIRQALDEPALASPGSVTERRVAMLRLVGEVFDFDETARRALGRHWEARTPAERAEFVGLFTRLLEDSYLSKLEMYRDERVTYLGDTIDRDEAVVRTRMVPPRGAEITIDYHMHLRSDRWRIYDVTADGVSLVDNYRVQFNKIIESSSYANLIAKMQALGHGETGRKTGR